MKTRKQARLSEDDRRFLEAFETAALLPEGFHHRDHLRAAWVVLGTYPLLESLGRFTVALKQLATRAGQPGIYHETITLAYLLLVHERLADAGEPLTWDDFVRANQDLFAWRPSVLDSYYGEGALAEERCRTSFVLPLRG